MKRKTLNILHNAYVSSIEQSNDILDIVTHLLDSLTNFPISDIPTEDLSQFDSLIKGIYTSKMIRQKTFQITNLVIDIATVISYIIIWLNHTKGMHVDINLSGRRKALETELEKILNNSETDDMACIHDRFGLRGIILNHLPPEAASNLLLKVSEYIVPILTRKNRNSYQEFLQWLETNSDIEFPTKERIKFILNLPFNLMIYKDYVHKPKQNNYQSLHYILNLDMFSPHLPGAELEIQLRTYEMHQTSVKGSAAHTKYEKTRRQSSKGIFQISDFSNVKINGFSSYQSPEDDIDGIHFHKNFINRRISPTLVNI